jgi:hypothetical protein
MLSPNQWATDVNLEMELKSALDEGRPLSTVAHLLIEAFESGTKAKKQTAIRFLQLHPEWNFWKKEFGPWLQNEMRWPWELILSWLSHQRLTLSLHDRQLLSEAIEKQKASAVLARFPDWGVVFPQVSELRNQARFDVQKKILEVRDLLFEELRTWKSQRLHEQEFKVLQRLKAKFPNDPDIQSEQEKFRQKQAVETLGAKIRQKRSQKVSGLQFKEEITQIPEELEQELLNHADLHPEKAYDMSIACCFMEDWVTALHLVNRAEASAARDWLELEILLNLKRFVDVLQALQVIEMRWAHDGETFFATAYVRAQALYGLGQKEKALEVLESLLASRPLYRQGVELLHIWRGSLA